MGTMGHAPLSALNVALLGAGRLGALHARTLAAIPEARLLVVADPRSEARQLGERYGARAAADPYEAIGDPDVDAVVIVTPTATHAGLIEAAARAGKAIFCEKPIALDVPSTERALGHDPYPPPAHYIPGCGGQFVDMTIHDIDIARFVTGLEVASVIAVGEALGPQAETFRAAGDWDTTVLTLRFETGALGSIVNSRQ